MFSSLFPKRLIFRATPEKPEPTGDMSQEQDPQRQREQQLAQLSRETREQQERRESRETSETPEISPEVREEASREALERDQQNAQEIEKLDANDFTAAKIKLKLVQEPATLEYIEETGHEELKRGFETMAQNTHEEIDKILESQKEVQEAQASQSG